MKLHLLLLPIVLSTLTGCGTINKMNCLVNASTQSIETNRYAIESSTQAVQRSTDAVQRSTYAVYLNSQLVEASNAAIAENRRHLQEAAKE